MSFLIWFGFGILGAFLFFLGGVFMCSSYDELRYFFMSGGMVIVYVFAILLGMFSFICGAAFFIFMLCVYFAQTFVLKENFGKDFFDKIYSILYKDKG